MSRAWQNPEKSLRLKHLVPRTPQYSFVFKFNVVCEMLRIGPWCRLPLTVRWLKQEYKRDFPITKQPPTHMPIEYGLVEFVCPPKGKKALRAKGKNKENEAALARLTSCFKSSDMCQICATSIIQSDALSKGLLGLKCPQCQAISHTICLAKKFVDESGERGHVLPIEGFCLKCDKHTMWGDLIKYRLGSFRSATEDALPDGDDNDEDDDDEDDDEDEEFVERDDQSGCEDEGNDFE